MKSEKYYAIGYVKEETDDEVIFLKDLSSDGYTVCSNTASEGFTFKTRTEAINFLRAISPLLIQTFNIYEINIIITLRVHGD